MSDEQYNRDPRDLGDAYNAHWAPGTDAPVLGNHASNHASADKAAAIPDELRGVYARLLTDGAAWSATTVAAPDTLIRYTQALPQVTPQTRMERAPQLIASQNPFAVKDAPVSVPRLPQPAQSTHPRTGDARRSARWPTALWAPVAAVVIVALVVAVFYGFAIRFRGPVVGVTAPKTPTVPGVHGRWTHITALDYTTALQGFISPVVAPNNPQVVYEPLLADAHNLSSATLRRTDDSGKTWHTLALPVAAPTQFAIVGIAVSPLDAHTVLLTIERSNLATCPTDPFMHGGANGTQTLCYLQYVSQDGGGVWRTLSLPIPGLLDQVGQFATSLFPLMIDPFYAQGNDLYALDVGGLPPVSTAPRLVMSADGGLTWRVVDTALNVQLAGQNDLCAFASTPTGATVFAVTTTNQQSCVSEGIFILWRSDDAGAHWRQVTRLPTRALDGLLVSPRSNASLILYADFPSVVVAGGGVSTTGSSQDLNMSADGGLTWRPIAASGPLAAGLPPASENYGLSVAWPEGGVLRAYAPGQDATIARFYAWTPATQRWQAVTPPVTADAAGVVSVGEGAITLVSSDTATVAGTNQPVTFTFWRYLF